MRLFLGVILLFTTLPAFSQLKSVPTECIDIAIFHGNEGKSSAELATIREADNLKHVLLSLKNQANYCIQRAVEMNGEFAKYAKDKLTFDVRITGTPSGKLEASCECEKYIKTSRDLGEARYRLMAGNCYSSVISKYKMPENKKLSTDKTFCWDGVTIHKTAAPQPTPAPSGGVH